MNAPVLHSVTIPGIAQPVNVLTDDPDFALREALDIHGLHFAPDGTTVEVIDRDGRPA